MQQEARDYQAAATRDREADRQEMLRRTAATQPAPGPSHQDVAPTRPPPSASQESRRATASQPTPGPSQEDPTLSRYRQLLAAGGTPATQPAPSSTQGRAAPTAAHSRDRLAAAAANGPPGPDILPDGDEIVQQFHPPTVRSSDTLNRRGTAQESRIGPAAFAADVRPSRSLEGRHQLSAAGPPHPPRGRNDGPSRNRGVISEAY